mgnify:CR=1 FL=1
MCFDTKSSLIAFVLAWGIAMILYIRNRKYDRWNGLFLATFSLIQLLEGAIWEKIEQNQSTEFLTKLVLLALLYQPLMQCFGAFKSTHKKISLYCCYIFIALLIYGIWRVINSKDFLTTVGPNGHLIWQDKSSKNFLGPFGILYLLGIFVPLFWQDDWAGIPLILVGIFTALYSWMKTRGSEFSSYWCFTSVIYGLVCLAM